MALAVQIPCIACSLFHDVHDTPAEYHHTRGKTDEGAHLDGYSLCPRHHRHKDNRKPPRWISRHGDGLHAFEARYATESNLLAEMRGRIEKLKESIVCP